MVARRLINGALGVRGPTRTPEQREKERALLQAERGIYIYIDRYNSKISVK